MNFCFLILWKQMNLEPWTFTLKSKFLPVHWKHFFLLLIYRWYDTNTSRDLSAALLARSPQNYNQWGHGGSCNSNRQLENLAVGEYVSPWYWGKWAKVINNSQNNLSCGVIPACLCLLYCTVLFDWVILSNFKKHNFSSTSAGPNFMALLTAEFCAYVQA